MRASQPRLVRGQVVVTLEAGGAPQDASTIVVDGWVQIIQGEALAQTTSAPRLASCDAVRIRFGPNDQAVEQVEAGSIAAVSIHRTQVSFTEMEFVYVVLHHSSAAASPSPRLENALHLSTDTLGFLLVRREVMETYAETVGSHDRILDRFTATEDGNELMKRGALFPAIGLTPWTYRIVLGRPAQLGWIGNKVAERGPYFCGAPGNLELMLGGALNSWPGDSRSLPEHNDLSWFRVELYASGPHGTGVGTFVLTPCGSAPEVDEPLINADPATLWVDRFGEDEIDPNWIDLDLDG